MSRRPMVAAALVVCLFSSTQAQAQSKLEFTPFIGAYLPTKPLIADTAGSTSFFETRTGVVFGARLGYWLSPRFGLEASLGLSPTETRLFASSSTTTDLKFRSSAFMADIRGRFDVTKPSAPTRLHLSAGVAYTRASNALFDLADEIGSFKFKTSIGGVVGAGVSRRIASAVDLRIDLEDRIYKTDFEQTGTNFKSRTQHDFVFATGLGFHL